jgi:uncharacterized membrane protein YqaE (UPF0057 family)
MQVPLAKLDDWGLERTIFYLVPHGGTAGRRGAFGSREARSRRPDEVTMGNLLRILLAIVAPPVGVFLQVGLGLHFWLNILLTIMGYLPGSMHAVWILLRTRGR